jgi:hypothetical protein
MITNTVFVLIMGMSASLMLFILTNVWTWPFASVPLAVSSWSLLLGGGMAAGASILLWLVAEPWLRVVVILSLLPLFLTVAAIATACVGVVFRNQINSVVSKALSAGLHSPKGVLSFISATANFTAFVLASLVIAIAWVTNLSFQLSTQPIFGFDLISTSVIVLAVSAAVTILSQSSGPRPVMTFGEAALTFLVTCVTIVLAAGLAPALATFSGASSRCCSGRISLQKKSAGCCMEAKWSQSPVLPRARLAYDACLNAGSTAVLWHCHQNWSPHPELHRADSLTERVHR